MVPGGWLADWRGGKKALVASGLGTAAFVAATGVCGYLVAGPGLAFGALLLVRFSMGILTTPLFPAAGRIAHAWIPFRSRACVDRGQEVGHFRGWGGGQSELPGEVNGARRS